MPPKASKRKKAERVAAGAEKTQDTPTKGKTIQVKKSDKRRQLNIRHSFDDGDGVAEHDKDAHGYLQDGGEFFAKDPFSLRCVTITTDNYKKFLGCKAVVAKPRRRQHFPFVDLPPEIRNMIYSLLLAKEGYDILVQGTRPKTIRTCFELPVTSGGEYGHTSRRSIPQHLRGPCGAILSANRQIHGEASAILYGCNNFRTDNSFQLENFLKNIGSYRALLRRVEIASRFSLISMGKPARNCARLLKDAVQLERFHLDIHGGQFWSSEDEIVSAFGSLLLSLCRLKGGMNQALKIMTLPSTPNRCRNICAATFVPLRREVDHLDRCHDCQVELSIYKSIYDGFPLAALALVKKSVEMAERPNTGRPKRAAVTKQRICYKETAEEDTDTEQAA